jgi:hypothetical protein
MHETKFWSVLNQGMTIKKIKFHVLEKNKVKNRRARFYFWTKRKAGCHFLSFLCLRPLSRKITDEKKSCWLAQRAPPGQPQGFRKDRKHQRKYRDIDQQTGTDLKR